MAQLEEYKRKRDFAVTPEPGPKVARSESGFSYLIQKHEATRLHYDFRLELNGVLLSWAVTRGPSLNPEDKRLAVQTEDHPLAYGGFEGVIPAGEYGGGTVMLWDRGTWQPEGDPVAGMKKGHLAFTLQGERLKGGWHLVRMHPRKGEKHVNWLLIKQEDEYADTKDGDKLLKKALTGIASGQKMEQIAADGGSKVWHSTPDKEASAPRKGKDPKPSFVPPQLAQLGKEVPQGKGWLHEMKFDGYRLQAHKSEAEVTLYTRNGKDWTAQFQPIADALADLPGAAVLDGEVVALDTQGHDSFRLLQNALEKSSKAKLVYYLFDLLFLDGRDLRKLPLSERKALLQQWLGKAKGPLRYSDHIRGGGEEVFRNSCGLAMEGIISKRADGTYHSGRSPDWVKSKCTKRQEMVILGYSEPTHAGRGIGALVLGVYEGAALVYAGKVGTGFTEAEGTQLRKKLDALSIAKPVAERIPRSLRGVRWAKPQLVAEISFTEWTDEGALRHPSFLSLRSDKDAKQVKRESEAPMEKITAKPKKAAAKTSAKADGSMEIAGVRVSHPDKVMITEGHATKRMLAEYYVAVAEAILPQIQGRPLSLVRCPDGTTKACFFQRHAGTHDSPHIHSAGVANDEGEDYLMVQDAAGLVALVQMGVLELHPWGTKASTADKADRIIFDLDPDEAVSFAQVKQAAQQLRDMLEGAGFTVFLKTTGGKGLHLVIPLKPTTAWPEVKNFAQAVARSMEQAEPKNFISKMSKAARKGKIFIDYLRNDETATAVAAYSTRARPNAPVAAPLGWAELKNLKAANLITIQTMPARLKKKGDLWRDMDEAAAANSKALGKLLQAGLPKAG